MLFKNKHDELPPFVMSSVPKSGTHLLHQLLNGIPGVTNDITNSEKKFFLDYHPQDPTVFKDHFYRLAHLQSNEYGLGHFYCTPEYSFMLKRLNLKHIFIYRDPRDVLVSLTYYIPYKWDVHPLSYDFRENIKDPKERILMLLKGVEMKWPSFENWTRPIYKWAHDPTILKLSFEDFMLSEQSRRQSIKKMVHFLWDGLTPPVSIEEMVFLMEKNINTSESYTFRKGKIGAWREEFDDEIKDKFKEMSGKLLIDFGYEKDNNW